MAGRLRSGRPLARADSLSNGNLRPLRALQASLQAFLLLIVMTIIVRPDQTKKVSFRRLKVSLFRLSFVYFIHNRTAACHKTTVPSSRPTYIMTCEYDYLRCKLRLEHNCRCKVKQNAKLSSTDTEVRVNQTLDSFFAPSGNLLLLFHHIT